MWHHHQIVRDLLTSEGLRQVLEIGVDKGFHTRMLLEALEPLDGRLTSIDPTVGFLLRMRLRRNPRSRILMLPSLEALPRLQAAGERFDCAIVDGDHNWYTVFHELEGLRPMLAPRGVILLHDVEWPYARRDMYYDPARVPAEFRRPFARRGIVEGQSELAPEGTPKKKARNRHLNNALEEGGPRNGVLTAVEDFMAAHEDERWQLEIVPSHNGCGILRRGAGAP
jgi:hypothetical protein